jgi:hypothetical protein
MLHIAGAAPIDEAAGEATDQPETSVNLSLQQCTHVGGDVTAIKTGNYRPPANRFKREQLRRTLCRHRGAPRIAEKQLLHNGSLRFSAPMHLPCMRNPSLVGTASARPWQGCSHPPKHDCATPLPMPLTSGTATRPKYDGAIPFWPLANFHRSHGTRNRSG